MKRSIAIAAAVLALAGWSRPAAAQVFGQFHSARPLAVNGHEFGGYVEFSENLLGFLGQLRLSFHPGVDFGVQGGIGRYDTGPSDVTTARLGADFKYLAAAIASGSPVDLGIGRYDTGPSDVTTARLGTDFKYLAAAIASGSPVDLGVGAGIGLETGDDLSLLSIGPALVVSRPLDDASDPRFVAYGGLALLFTRVDVGGGDTNDVIAPVRMGCEFLMAPGLKASAELKWLLGETFQDDVSLAAGIRTSF